MSGSPYELDRNFMSRLQSTDAVNRSAMSYDTNESRKVGFTSEAVVHSSLTSRASQLANSGNASDGNSHRLVNTINGVVILLADHVISHPFIVIRRQCQVNLKSTLYHLTPFSIIPLIIRIESKQGFAVLWKGIASVLITKGLLIALEALISEITKLPRDLSTKKITLDILLQHLLLKGIATALITPFYCSSCIETVQSSVVSENPGVLDCIKEGFSRSVKWKMGRKLPIWLLVGPTVVYHISHYALYNLFANISNYLKKQNKNENDSSERQFNETISAFWGNLFADILLYPLQTVIFRLYLQGTRTIIDNVENSGAVIPVISDYDSSFDCYATIVKEEGNSGLFKGFGALIFQYTVHYSIIRLTKYFIFKMITK